MLARIGRLLAPVLRAGAFLTTRSGRVVTTRLGQRLVRR